MTSLVLATNIATSASALTAQDKSTKTTVPTAEAKAAKAIEAAPDVTAKFVAAEAFVKKYPASKARPQVAQYLANQVFTLTDPNAKLTSGQRFIALFNDPAEVKLVQPALIDSYIQLRRVDEAFDTGAAYLATDAEDVQVRTLLALAGAELTRSQNVKYIKVSQEYGAKAIELIEADKKPTTIDDSVWVKEKGMLPILYQQMAIISMIEQKPAEAGVKLEKAVKLNPSDPFNYALLGSIVNNDYQTLALTLQSMPDSKSKEESRRKANQLIDKVIEHYARAVALAEGKPQYKPLRDQLLQDLSTYYKYRHNNSEEGLQKYIETFKAP
jgi:hypothetical protein